MKKITFFTSVLLLAALLYSTTSTEELVKVKQLKETTKTATKAADKMPLSIPQTEAAPLPVFAPKTINELVLKDGKSRHKVKEVLDFIASGQTLKRAFEFKHDTGMPVSVTMALLILESDCGKSKLVKETKNKGNIKCRCNWSKKLRKEHAKRKICIKHYDKIEKSSDYYVIMNFDWEDWTKRKKIINRYRHIKAVQQQENANWMDWVQALHKSPYATDKHQDKKLTKLIETFALYNLDAFQDHAITSISGEWVFWEGSLHKS